MKLRAEKPEDRSTIATLIARTYLENGAKLIEMTGLLRDVPAYRPELGIVAEVDEAPVAYALFTPLMIGGKEGAVLLAPLAMDTEHPDVDYNAFLHDAIEQVKKQGFKAVLMHGVAEMYADDGFELSEAYGIESPIRYPGTALLVKPFGVLKLSGKVEYPKFLADF